MVSNFLPPYSFPCYNEMNIWRENEVNGLFITLEGPEGAGKTTQIRFLEHYLQEKNISYISLREPGGTRIGQQIRELLLHPDLTEMGAMTELLLYAASRAQLVTEKIAPALASGKVVICDRYIDSTMVYQGFAGSIPDAFVQSINQAAIQSILPLRTYVIDLPWEIGEQRIQARGTAKDRIEQKSKEYHQRVREGYQKLAEREQGRIRVLDGTLSEAELFAMIREDLELLLAKHQSS